MYKVVEFNNEELYINDFINIAHNLYSKDKIMQNDFELRQVLTDRHILCKYFNIKKFLVYKNNIPVSRLVVTFYPDDDIAYFGYFETENDLEAVKILFNKIFDIVKQNNKDKITGPVNANFWLGYRLKVNNFNDLPYTGEPYNKDYYYELLRNVGFLDYQKYYTNFYNKPEKNYFNAKANKRYLHFMKKGYELKTLNDFTDKENINIVLYDMLIDLYKDFPTFKWIPKEDFLEIFKDSYKICDDNMQKFFYYKGQPVAFCITFPNYNNLLLQDGKESQQKILQRKVNSTEYIITYMGVKKGHAGLGLAMVNEVVEDIKVKNAHPVGALIKSGKVTSKYINEEIIKQNEYVLLYKNI